jgi:hypothetical protein
MIILAVDPGKTSGVARLSWSGVLAEAPIVDYSAELSDELFAGEIKKLFEHNDELFFVCCESFIINAQTVRNSQAPYSLEQIGVLKHLCREIGYDPKDIAFQAPVNAKNMFPNPALKILNTWHKGGDGHANDAIRHALLRMVKAGWVPRELLK